MGIGCLVVGIPVSFVMKSRPEDYGMLPDGAPLPEGDDAQQSSDARRAEAPCPTR